MRLGLPPISTVDLVVHPRDNDLVIATHARGFYVLDDVTPLQELARDTSGTTRLFEPTPAVRYNPASDTSVLGNRAWVSRNQPYGVILSYYLPQAVSAVQFTVADARGRVVQTLSGPGAAGLNRAVWNLAESSSCGPAPAGGRGGRGGAGGTWVRAIPGEYTIKMTAGAETREASATVRLDPRVKATDADMQAWLDAAHAIERAECTLARANADLAALEQAGVPASELRPLVLALRGDPNDPGHVNLPGRINWLTIQVGNYSGRPTAAQAEWIKAYGEQAAEIARRVEELKKR